MIYTLPAADAFSARPFRETGRRRTRICISLKISLAPERSSFITFPGALLPPPWHPFFDIRGNPNIRYSYDRCFLRNHGVVSSGFQPVFCRAGRQLKKCKQAEAIRASRTGSLFQNLKTGNTYKSRKEDVSSYGRTG